MRRLTRIMAAAVFGLLVGTAASQAQTQLINPTTQQWRYLADNTDPGATWSTTAFDDSAWPTGTGLFGNEANYPYPVATSIAGPSGGGPPTTYYRTRFTYNGGLTGVVLTGTNYIDDGNVVYLNGVEITRFNMPDGVPTMATFAVTANPGGFPNINNGEPVLVRMQIPLDTLTNGNANPLRVGENVLAVEVHNNSATSSDTAFTMALYSQQSVAPCTDGIQPTDRSVIACRNTTFTVVQPSNCGIPAPSIQWFRNLTSGGGDQAIAGATGSSVTISNVTTADQGQYFAVLNNGVGPAVQSRHAVLTVTPDSVGPQVISVEGVFGADNQFLVTFDEAVLTQGGADDAFTWEISDVNDPTALFTVQNIAIVTGRPDQVLFSTDLSRIAGHKYTYRTTQDIKDECGQNTTPPGLTGNVLLQGPILDYSDTKIWRYDDTATDRGTAWRAPSYDDSGWATGQQLFDRQRADLGRTTVAGQTVRTMVQLTNFTVNPPTNLATIYLRVKLTVPAGTTKLVGYPIYDDGFILYVNGNEVYRTNVQATADQWGVYGGVAAINPGDANYIAPFEIPISSVTVGGENTLAIMMKQSDSTSSDVTFGLRIIATAPSFAVDPIVILQQPVSTAVTEGHSLRLSVAVSGSQPSYQWFKDNVAIDGATSATFTKVAVAGDAGIYHVVVSNSEGPVTSASATVTVRPVIVSYGATWRYEVASQDATLSGGTPWYAPGFDDSAWPSGPGLFGVEGTAGTVARMPAPIATALPVPSATFLTAYFRSTITVPTLSAGQSLVLTHFIDDGAAIYLDGVLALRYNLTNDPPILSTALTPGAVPGDGDAVLVSVPVTLSAGQHSIAVEVHQNSATSSDVVFGAELRTISGPAPSLTITQPTATSVQVTWTANSQYSLYQATSVTGPFTAVGGNPQGTYSVANIAPDAARFFQLRFNGQ